jgi:hypothetical protein
MAKVNGSVALIPYNTLDINRVDANAAASPIAMP